MSKERELIKDMKILLECTDMGGLQRNADVLIGRAIELLAQPEQPNEPVAWFYDYDGTTWIKLKEPDLPNMHHSVTNVRPLYTSPPTREPFNPDWANYRQGIADAKREPLSTKQAEDLWETTFKSAVPYYIFDEICVAIEQYHGIGVDDE